MTHATPPRIETGELGSMRRESPNPATTSPQGGTHRERRLTDLSDLQHGVVHLDQLRALGLSARAVSSRAAVGRLRRLYRGVYAVRGPVSRYGWLMAAVLACGEGSVISHRSGEYLQGLVPSASSRPHVTNGTGSGWRHALHVHQRVLTELDVTTVDRIPVTSLPRTLLDLAACTPDLDTLRRAIGRSETLRSFDLVAAIELLSRTAGHRGHARLTAALELQSIETVNKLEDAMHHICAEAGLPRPLVNRWLAFADGTGVRPDFLWPDQRVAVETDGYGTHGTRRAFATDRARDRRLRLETGIETYRFTYAEVIHDPALVKRELIGLLRR